MSGCQSCGHTHITHYWDTHGCTAPVWRTDNRGNEILTYCECRGHRQAAG